MKFNMKADELAKDDDLSLSSDMFDMMCNDDFIRSTFNNAVSYKIQHPDQADDFFKTYLIDKMLSFGADFYKERAYDNE